MSKTVLEARLSRREALKRAGALGAGAVLGGTMTACTTTAQTPNLDVAILNFALNLEYLEGLFYLAATGRLSELNQVGGNAQIVLPPGFSGTSPVPGLTGDLLALANEIADDEKAHVLFLRQALGSQGVNRPVIDLYNSFNAIKSGFNPFNDPVSFFVGAFVFEDVGVTAYNGAAPLITDKQNVLAPAAGILAAEAYHAGAVRRYLIEIRNLTVPNTGLTVEQLANAIANARNQLAGGGDEPLTRMGTGTPNIVPADQNGVVFSRTTDGVLNIVYLNAQKQPGGFFPQGLNGQIK
ncbi:ferritin-like domain-containing protein [Thermus sp.]|uniref:ferritin-like domain-containing protein n=1 Tax=Thermus sp. TaxID=275 RepID=UPI0028CD13A0|nr:ferritin-like domain-containing protein [Thermus sp.]MDT7909326.1 ferritin-like domain-containing protein [Thermus sp.]